MFPLLFVFFLLLTGTERFNYIVPQMSQTFHLLSDELSSHSVRWGSRETSWTHCIWPGIL